MRGFSPHASVDLEVPTRSEEERTIWLGLHGGGERFVFIAAVNLVNMRRYGGICGELEVITETRFGFG